MENSQQIHLERVASLKQCKAPPNIPRITNLNHARELFLWPSTLHKIDVPIHRSSVLVGLFNTLVDRVLHGIPALGERELLNLQAHALLVLAVA